MSARAAWRLESLGFTDVYRYTAGKVDWVASLLPLAGTAADERRAVAVARPDVPTCGLRDPVAAVAGRLRDEGWPLAVVVNRQRVVLGRLRPKDVEAHPEAVAEEIMVPGPRTIRSRRPASELPAWLDERRVPGVLVTTPDGVLIGYIRREDV